jgi:IS66 Orf2 like protein
MLPQLSAAVRVFLCARPTDLRKGFDGLSGLVQECFSQDLLTGHLFLFLNRRRDRMKILYFDRDGLVIWYKKQEEDYPHCAGFTGIGRHLHNLLGWPAQAGGLDSRPSRCGSGRYSMSRATALIAPPRPCRSSSRGRSTDSGVF